MLATSWKATGLVRQAWQRLEVKSYKRERLAELTGIPAPNLSRMNTGKMPMTLATAEKIVQVVPGITVLDLGATEAGDDAVARTALLRLAELEATLERVLIALDDAGIELPADPQDGESDPSEQQSRRALGDSD